MIHIKDKEGEDVPFVREVLVESLTKAGMKPWQAHSFSREIETELIAKAAQEIDREDFIEIVHSRLTNVNSKVAERFRAWREIKGKDREPIIVLIGGGTGVGTTTVGTELAYRMGIKNTISTDSIREIMRKTVSEKLLPVLHVSSYEAYKQMKVDVGKKKGASEAIIAGFKLQASEVSVGVEAIIERALKEGTPTLIEGLHIVPGMINEEIMKKPNVMMFILHLKNEKEHKDRLYSRAFETKFRRSVENYVDNFKGIREIQKFITKEAENNKVELLENKNFELSITEIMDDVISNIVKQQKKDDA